MIHVKKKKKGGYINLFVAGEELIQVLNRAKVIRYPGVKDQIKLNK